MLDLALKHDNQSVKNVWFSSATSALIASLEAVETHGKWVAVAPNVCPNVIAAIFASGAKPWFVDIEPQRQGIDPKLLTGVISQVAAVIAVHAYGVPCEIEQIAEIANEAGVPLIEDCAQADGAEFLGKAVGSFGDIAVFSFGTGKIIDAGGGGLAVVQMCFQDNIDKVINDWPEADNGLISDELGSVYRFFYNRFYPHNVEVIQESFLAFIKKISPLFKTRCNTKTIPHLIERRKELEAIIEARREKYSIYIKHLSGTNLIQPLPLLQGVVPWRFNIIIDVSYRDLLFKQLLNSDVKASTWYPRISIFLPNHSYKTTSDLVAKKYECGLLNLWLDETISNEQIVQNCGFLKNKIAQLMIEH
ncbi:MAG TPA: DegT/DnrJ/EryC1/StrS family aminotransferase [Methylotenera sp.]|nr:DegT/DnrJ/EryC1/StrS family aminotransferase [Methylotenera sp.]